MTAEPKRIALLAVVALVIVTTVLLLRDDKPAPDTPGIEPTPLVEATAPVEDEPREKPRKTHRPRGTIKEQLETAEESGWSEVGEYESAEVSANCDEPGTREEEQVLPNARLYYRDWQGEEPDDSSANRASACLNETGRVTELGFNNVIEGESFGVAKGEGDFVALTTYLWDGADASSDGFQFWDLRSGKSEIHDPGCGTDSDECTVADVAVTTNGSFAYSACEEDSCRIYVKEPGDKRLAVAGDVSSEHGRALLAKDGIVYWLDSDGELASRRLS
jgi:hypothetical protein